VVGERKFQVGATVHDDLILALDLQAFGQTANCRITLR
jgi:hypothetical protein